MGAFRLTYEVSLTAVSLKMTLNIENTGDAPFQFHCLLHTYFRVPAIEETAVHGLRGRKYADKVAGDEKKESEAEIRLPKFTDRVYIGENAIAKDVTIGKSGCSPSFALTNEAKIDGVIKPCDVVVW